jgi:predicted dehydrogenase/threonine dehydrogenase-like Zn-dependent dehydrogenase
MSESRVTGYSVAGVVVAVGSDVDGVQVGDAVAAAGAGYAHHAEYVDVPANLVMPMPAGLGFREASTVTLGGIALHAVRRADFRLGELAVVFGGGILGLLAVQLLRCGGVRVAVVDLDDGRLKLATALGAERVINARATDPVEEVKNWSGGKGADGVLFSASTSSSEPLSQAFKMCRKKGRVILVGVCGMQINRDDMYVNEVDLKISTSYGPGRYDKNYEEKGHDYPYAYVRWTEKRNMTEYLRLLCSGDIQLEEMINATYAIADAEQAFLAIQESDARPLMVLLDYGEPLVDEDRRPAKTCIELPGKRVCQRKQINVALVGAGNFARNMHLPILLKLKDKFCLRTVMNRTGTTAKDVATQFGAERVVTAYHEVLDDPDVDLVLICTRHDSHADLVLQALQSGKHVFVEKPLAVTHEQLQRVEDFYQAQTGNCPLLFVGFNRRFSPFLQEVQKVVARRVSPMSLHYRFNAGFFPAEHWVHDDGGRIVGEACHAIDVCSFLVGCRIASIGVEGIHPVQGQYSRRDNKCMVLAYEDGSMAIVEYLSLGHPALGKERIELHYDGKSVCIDDFKQMKGYGVPLTRQLTNIDKGHYQEWLHLHQSISSDTPEWPITLDCLLETTSVAIAAATERGVLDQV